LDFGDLNFTARANGYRQRHEMHWLKEACRAAALRRDTPEQKLLMAEATCGFGCWSETMAYS
jgi:hypothetical protein